MVYFRFVSDIICWNNPCFVPEFCEIMVKLSVFFLLIAIKESSNIGKAETM